jgi:photosystem II stability/assembly factor-like uncharacterized protein
MTPSVRSIVSSTLAAAILTMCAPSTALAEQWRNLLPDVPSRRQVIIDPINPSNLYIATESGIYKSSDAGLTWTLLSNGLPTATPMGVAISASLGAGRFREVPTIYVLMPDFLYGSFLYSSHDDGASWSRCGPPLSRDGDPVAVSRIAVDPLDARIVYAVSSNYTAIHKSVDACRTWRVTGTANLAKFPVQFEFSELTIDPANPRVLYGASYRSTNGGDTFDGPQTSPFRQTDRRFTWTAQYRLTGAPPAPGVEVSWDAGATWAAFPAPAGGPIESLYVDRRDSVVYVVRGQTLYRTTDQGSSWVPESLPLDVCDAAALCPDGLLTLDPFRPSTLYIGSDWKSIDYGHVWTRLSSAGMRDHLPDVLSVATAPSNPDTVYASIASRPTEAGAQTIGVMRSENGGDSWATFLQPASVRPLRDLTVDAADDRRVYAIAGDSGTTTRLMRSVDGGQNWTFLDPPGFCGTELRTRSLSAAAAAGTLFVVVGSFDCGILSKSIDGGDTWSIVSTRFGTAVDEIVTDAVDPLLLYVLSGTRGFFGGIIRYDVERSQDGGATFQTLPQLSPAFVPTAHPTIRGKLSTGGSGAILQSIDAGSTWTSIPLPLGGSFAIRTLVADSSIVHASLQDVVSGSSAVWQYDPNRSDPWKNVGLTAAAALTVARGPAPAVYAGTSFRDPAATGIWRLEPPVSRIAPLSPISAPPPDSIVAGAPHAVDAAFDSQVSIGVVAPEYQFSRWDPFIGWHVVQDFSAAKSFTWTPQATDAGTHAFQVTIRDAAGPADPVVKTFDRTFTVPSANSIGPAANLVARSAPTDLQRILFDNNADGLKDLFVYNRASGEWAIYTGTRDGFTDGPSGGWAPGWSISVADFNGDRFDDFFLYSRQTGVFYKVINTGAGFRYFGQGWRPGFDIYIVDFNGDRKSDVFIHDPLNGTWFTCISSGDGTEGFTYIGGGWATGWQITPADFDGNGRADLFLYDRATGGYYKVMTLADGTFDYTPGQAERGRTPTIVDVNGDGRSDVLFYETLSGSFERCTSTGDGTAGFGCVGGGWLPGFSVYAANFDNDERTDLFLHQAGSGMWFKVLNGPDGLRYTLGGWAQWNVDVTELDGDRRSDVFLFDPRRALFFKALTSWPNAFDYVSGLIR